MTNLVSDYIPMERSKLMDKSCPSAVLVSYQRLYTTAWDGDALRTLVLDLETELLDILNVSLTQAKEHLRWLRFGKWITYERLNGKVRIGFPASGRKTDLTGSENRPQVGKPTSIEREVGKPTPESESVNYINSDSNSSWPQNEKDLAAAYARVLAVGPVFANIRKQLAIALAGEGPRYLPHLLGHLARAKSGRHTEAGYNEPGVYLKDHAELRDELPAADLPPTGLSFLDALKWAINGGKTDAEIAEAERLRRLQEAQEQVAQEQTAESEVVEPLPANADPSVDAPLGGTGAFTPRTIWQAALRQLPLEMPKQVFESWLIGAAVLSYCDGQLTIGVDNQYKADWLTNRMIGTVKRTVSGIAGRDVSVVFVAAPVRLHAEAN